MRNARLSNLVSARTLAALALVLSASTWGCGYRVRVGANDGGAIGCRVSTDCEDGNQCVCNRCITLDLPPETCDPPCSTAEIGDFCTMEGRVCERGCDRLECRSGSFVRTASLCEDGGTARDAGWCECPAPPPGCTYDGSPCVCDHLTCEPQRCGRVVCGEGTVCCNASCGTCAAPELSCPAIACEPDCTPMQAWGQGGCELELGVLWNGSACVGASGCSCSGTDCPNLFASISECQAEFSACGRPCGGFAGATCLSTEYCDGADVCGGGGTGTCQTRPTVCPPVIAPVCGCDGNTYQSECAAQAQGTDVASDGPCS